MLILIGPSASGKTEIAKKLMNKYNIKKVVTYTTRKQRENEVDKIDYNFISENYFKQLEKENFFVETTFYNNNYYGTAKKDISDDKCIVVDPNGFKSFLKLHDNHIISFFLECSEKVRKERMILRKDKMENIIKRLENDKLAFDKNNIEGITYYINSEKESVEVLADKIYSLYIKAIEL